MKKLREAGAVILGKANMTELANGMSSEMWAGYSSRGGQTLNPYGDPTLFVGGSSSGSAVAVASNFSVLSVGTETDASILSPAIQNSVVGIKPTVGLISRSGIIPFAYSQDTAGPYLSVKELYFSNFFFPSLETVILGNWDLCFHVYSRKTDGFKKCKEIIERNQLFIRE